MGILITGSAALAHHLGDKAWREAKDVDLFAPGISQEDCPKGVEVFWHPDFTFWLHHPGTRYATLNELYTIKMSHIYWELNNGSWNKHATDLRLLKAKGAKLMYSLHDMLYKVWEEKHGSKKMKLDQESRTFFKDAVKRKYDHDSLHKSVAFTPGEPLYERFLKPGSEVDMDMAAVKEAPYWTQVDLFCEEIMATALERLIIPNNYNYSPGAAWMWALRRTITSLTKGWSAQFIADNMHVFRIVDPHYVSRHRENSHYLIPLED